MSLHPSAKYSNFHSNNRRRTMETAARTVHSSHLHPAMISHFTELMEEDRSFPDPGTMNCYCSDGEFLECPSDSSSASPYFASAVSSPEVRSPVPKGPDSPVNGMVQYPPFPATDALESEPLLCIPGHLLLCCEAMAQKSKKNAIKKGDGPDSKPDPDDDYAFNKGAFYHFFKKEIGGEPPASLAKALVKEISTTFRGVVEKPRRMQFRRQACAHAWLDRNWDKIPELPLKIIVRRGSMVGNEHGL
jgi:hypothetical protein